MSWIYSRNHVFVKNKGIRSMKYNWEREGISQYGIVNVSVANLRLQPVYQSELMNQLILGTIVPIFEEQNDFYYIQNWDSYFGWINKHSVIFGDRGLAEWWQNASRVIVLENYGLVRKSSDKESEVLRDLVPYAILNRLDGNTKFTKVVLPDGKKGVVETNIVADEKTRLKLKISKRGIVNTANKFLGIPYLWGGTSAKGFDCSGFVQTVFRLLNLELPRDAKKMAEIGKEIRVNKDFSNLEVGDLLFFGKTLQRITHVAISLGQDIFMHSEGYVRVNNLDPGHPLFNEYRRKTFLKARRVF